MKGKLFLICIVFATFFITGCGSSSSESSTPTKDLFSLWKNIETNAPLDFTNGTFSTIIPMAFFFVGGAQCNCNCIIIGTQASGTYVLNSCSYKSGSGSPVPNCKALNSNGTYLKSLDILTLTNSVGTSTTYK